MTKNLPRLKEKYNKEIIAELKKELNIDNIMAVPNLTKIVINSGLGEAKVDKSIIQDMVRDMATIAGQRPVVTKSGKAISNFKIQKDQAIGVKVTLRGNMMWYFIDRLISVTLPRIKDFKGVSYKAFDGRGNYAIGIKEHTVFPEVDATKVVKIQGLQIIVCTNARKDEYAYKLLEKLGIPFQKKKKKS